MQLKVKRAQSGLALITVLLIFAIVSVLAVAMIDRQASDIQRSGTMLALQQARAYVTGAESAVKTGLYLDWESNPDIDHAAEEWNQERMFPLSPGTAYISIKDAQGRFNLNWLSKGANNREVQKVRFRNLLNELGLDVALADLTARWMDEESQEDDRYQSMEPPYRAAYRVCSHTSEMMLIEGFDAQTYRSLEGYIACLPVAAQLNVNTASAVVLSALDDELSLSSAQAIVAARGEEGFADVGTFWSLPEVEPFTRRSANRGSNRDNNNDSNDNESGNNDENDESAATGRWDETDFSVKSEYFESFIRVDLGDRIATAEVLIHRSPGSGKMNTLYRDYSRREVRHESPVAGSNTDPALNDGSGLN
ncbi:MAG: hypothetical protein CMI08_06710 [Oceanospirillaceae bacterium]|uniref:type II secretion system minor pseudopilin GspK n=1 Tax=unclassified Thalassolituus TaxID=2624967 RepID=UPI000C557EE0|nr:MULTISPECIES: type II secretion system minor pseudopilin GspK [unclassified Thalassolituus]MAS25460.1 hypothetical protein [Oceanospirillaceae bacterium]MAX98884.1 hypothetical protein [Oceanospirillaceae bacterium]MBS51977.1 hypothetical protein [Oceanospirillaceae bacterium]